RAARRSGGHIAFMWYRTPLRIPAKIDDFDPSGAVAVLRVTVDDYAEVWVNGAILGRSEYSRPASVGRALSPSGFDGYRHCLEAAWRSTGSATRKKSGPRAAPLCSRPRTGGHGCYRPLSCLACTLLT